MNLYTTRLLGVALLLGALVACSQRPQPVSTPGEDTIAAAIDATQTAEAQIQATVDAAVAATAQSDDEPTATVVPTATPEPAQPTATSAPGTSSDDYVTMTEEELEALIDEAVNEAIAAASETSSTTTDATTDGEVTEDEVQTIEVSLSDAEEAVAYAEDLLDDYYELYSETAGETIEAIAALEAELAALNESLTSIDQTLHDIDETLEAGLTLAEETVAQLESSAAEVQAAIGEAQTTAQDLAMQWQAEGRPNQAGGDSDVAELLAMPAEEVAPDRQAAIESTFVYVEQVRGALADQTITDSELATIAQSGANARAGLETHGGPQLQQLSGRIDETTGQLARGEVSQAQRTVDELETALGERSTPSRPDSPSGPSTSRGKRN